MDSFAISDLSKWPYHPDGEIRGLQPSLFQGIGNLAKNAYSSDHGLLLETHFAFGLRAKPTIE